MAQPQPKTTIRCDVCFRAEAKLASTADMRRKADGQP